MIEGEKVLTQRILDDVILDNLDLLNALSDLMGGIENGATSESVVMTLLRNINQCSRD